MGVPSRWEWRTFAPSFDSLDLAMPAEVELAHEIYILNLTSNINVKIRGGAIEVKTLDDVYDGLELWRPSFTAQFPLCQRDIRSVLNWLGVSRPQVLFSPSYGASGFLTDVACCIDGIRVIGVTKTRRRAIVDGCIVERASVSAAGHIMQTVAVESADEAAVRRQLRRLRLDRFDNLNYVEFLKGLAGAGVQPPAEHSPSAWQIHRP
ncbi:MAG TPA: hypothetical protein VF491_21460 [Vicinamibacterales bacterium]